jgi:hypothetical protein
LAVPALAHWTVGAVVGTKRGGSQPRSVRAAAKTLPTFVPDRAKNIDSAARFP